MKAISILSLVLAVLFVVSVSSCAGVKTDIKTVSAAAISQLPPDQTLEIDLTHDGTIYEFDDTAMDFSRVSIRTPDGVKNFGNLLKKAKTSRQGRLVLGTTPDMMKNLPIATGVTSGYHCGAACECGGASDCLDMIADSACSNLWCNADSNSCYCVPEP